MRRTFAVAAGVVLACTALAGDDPRGWSTGQVASGTTKVLAGAERFPVLDFPRVLTDRITGPTVLFYFSPTCHHCRHVAAEVEALSKRLTGKAAMLGVASGSSEEAALAEFRATYGVTFPILVDDDRSISAAMAVRSTPSAMLVAPKGKEKLEVRDLWYPYLPAWDALIEGRVGGDLWAVFRPGEYQGNNVCGSCHVEEHASWTLTHHSVAWRTLETRDKHTDAACTDCHVTGAGAPTGWDKSPDSALVDVGCEACHGPGGPHDGTRQEARDTCVGCHDADHSIAFDPTKAVTLIDHYRSNTLTDEQRDELRRQLYNGEAPRSLLAFPEGRNVGSDKCQTCHAVEHAWWSDDPHARAMSSLGKEGHDDPACVKCHATARTSGGLPPTTLDGFDTLGGVGCESCHGPGEKHLAAGGGTDNIQGLGESCPVCVIEALCTSCHTKKWSPDWNLDEALRHVTHQPTPPQ